MTPISNWNNTQAAVMGSSKKLPADGYICQIVSARVGKSQSGKDMLILLLDIADGEYQGYFREMFDGRRKFNNDAKWSNNAIYRQGVYEDDGCTKANPFFKGLIELVEACNDGYKWDWNEAGLKGKYLGVIFRDEEWEYNGKSGTSARAAYLCNTDDILSGNYTVPEVKKLAKKDIPFGGTVVNDIDIPF